jgi:hypothetical protein
LLALVRFFARFGESARALLSSHTANALQLLNPILAIGKRLGIRGKNCHGLSIAIELCATNLIQDTVQGKNADSFAGTKMIALLKLAQGSTVPPVLRCHLSEPTILTQSRQGSLLELFTCAHVQPWLRRFSGLMCAESRKCGAGRSSMKGWSMAVKGALDDRCRCE